MPNGSGDNAGECHWQHEFPGDIHDLIDARARERAADPDGNKKQRAQLCEEPGVRGDNFQHVRGRMPATEKQCHAKPADGEHSDVFRHEKCGVLESGILGHVTSDNF